MSAVTKQEIVEALRDMSLAVLEYATQDENDECEIDYRGLRANCAKLISRIEQHGIVPPDEWQPIETMPEDTAVDIWVKSKDNAEYGRRGCHVAKVSGVWYGENIPNTRYGEYTSHWRSIPAAPEVSK